jgi:hypothetical protein
MADPPTGSTPQFGTAEFAGVAGAELCQFCHQPITHRYYRINNAMACPACGERAQHSMPKDSHGQFIRGLAFGIGGAVIGLILYATFEIVSGFTIGYASLAVGYIVGKAIMMGSGGAGGRRYQITAAALTYLAVCLAVVPVFIHEVRSHRSEQAQQVQQKSAPDATEDQQPEQNQQTTQAPQRKRMSRGEALARLSLIGLESPFLELSSSPFQGLLGLVILLVGIRIAWRICAGAPIAIDGPFENAPAVS